MDRVIANALRRRAELRTQLKEIDKFLELYEDFKVIPDPAQPMLQVRTRDGGLQEQEGSEPEQDEAASVSEKSDPVGDQEGAGLSRAELLPHIKEAIGAAGRPLTRGQLLQKLDAKGVRVGGKADRSKNMGTIMWRLRENFVNLSGFGYWLRGQPFPLAGYDPTDQNSPEAIDYTRRESQPEESA